MGKLRKIKAGLVVGAAVASLIPLGATPAAAGGSEVGSQVSLVYRARRDFFRGRVDYRGDSSEASLCVANRKVELFKNRRGSNDRSFGWIRTNEQGAFAGQLNGGTPEGTYYVFARRKTFTDSYGDLVLCRADRSNEVTVR